MAGSREGRIKSAADSAGVSIVEYQRRVGAGQKWCGIDRAWHDRSEFGIDKSRYDGLAASCRAAKSRHERGRYVPGPPIPRGRSFVPARDDDREQARRRVNYFVEAGLLPAPNDLPCADCGHVWAHGERRHEYDHHLGYAAVHHEHVEAVCSTCHRAREVR